jgi:hypothetical protein
LEALTQASSEVVQGTISNIESFWNRSRTAIYTRLTLSSERTLKGSSPDEVTVLLPGGTVGETTSILVDAPELKPNQEVVLFLDRVDDLRQEVDLPASVTPFQLTDPLQSVFKVVTDPVSREKRAVSHIVILLPSDAVTPAQPELRSRLLSLGGEQGLPLDELAARVEQIR